MSRTSLAPIALLSIALVVPSGPAAAEHGIFDCTVKEGMEVQENGLLQRSSWGLWVINSSPQLSFELGRNILRHYGSPMQMTVVQRPTPQLDFVATYSAAGTRITWSRILRIRTNAPGMPFTFMMDDTIFSGSCTWSPTHADEQSNASGAPRNAPQ